MTITSFGKLLLNYEWKYIDILWDNPRQKEKAIFFGKYDPKEGFLFDVDRADDGRVFITATRDDGVPLGVMTVTEKQGEGGPLLRPYPDWSWYKDDCKGITGGVYQVEIMCNHLFVVDGGRIGENQLCIPQLLIFDLSTDKLVKRVIVPFNIAHNKTNHGLISTIAIFDADCQNVKDNVIELVAYDPKMEFVSGMKIRHGELLVLSNRYQIHIYKLFFYNNTFNTNEVNFRVFSMPIAEVEKNTKCFSSCN
ncbi:MRJP3 protein, partial [Acromyrmex heyeri]